jgi:hypothetical protein
LRDADLDQLAGPLVVVIGIGLRRLSKTLHGRLDLDPKLTAEVLSLLFVGNQYTWLSTPLEAAPRTPGQPAPIENSIASYSGPFAGNLLSPPSCSLAPPFRKGFRLRESLC